MEEEEETESLSAGQLEFLRRKQQTTGGASAEASSVAADAEAQQQPSPGDLWGSVAAMPATRYQTQQTTARPFEKLGLCEKVSVVVLESTIPY